jgi:glycerophosphoryl diester phosphodiesterase
VGEPSRLVRDAHRAWLTVHVWTVRAENRFLPTNLRRGTALDAPGDMAGEVRALLDAGVDGVITDHTEIALRTAREVLAPDVVGRVT